MKRLLNALRYGDWETRKSIGSVILFILLGIGLIIAAGLSGHFFLFVLGMLSGAVALMISQSFDLVDEDFVAEIDSKGTKDTVHSVTVKKDGIVFKNSDVFKMEAEAKKEAALMEEEAKKEQALLEEEKLLQEEIKKEAKVHKAKEKKEKSKKVKEKKERVRKEKQRKEKAEKEPKIKERKEKEKPVKVPRIKEEKLKDKKEKISKTKEKKIKEKIARDILEEETPSPEKQKKERKVKEKEVKENKIKENKEREKAFDEQEIVIDEEIMESLDKELESFEEDPAVVFEKYDKQTLVQVKKKYRVKRDHRPILIDNSKTYNIKECPAFIWRVHNKVYLLLLEKEPRKIVLSREMIKHVGYAPHVRGDKSREYRAFEKDNLITTVFKDYLPNYYNYKTEKGSYRAKNLYYIHPDIQITSRSISQVMDLLYLNFMPSDRITRSEEFNGFFKRIYAANLMFNDKAYTITEYKSQVEKVLEEMCNVEMPEREFNNTLENLVRARFISQEYADHYYRVRDKVRR